MISHAAEFESESSLHFCNGVAVVLGIVEEGVDLFSDQVYVLYVPLVQSEVVLHSVCRDAWHLWNVERKWFVFHIYVVTIKRSVSFTALYHGDMERRLLTIRIVMLAALVFVLVAATYGHRHVFSQESPHLTVRFLDVGQGDSIHIATPDGVEVLIDGGPSAGVLRELSKGRSFFDREIDLMVATHPDTDHIGGLVDVLERFSISTILETANVNDTPAVAAYENAAAREGARRIDAAAGQMIALGASTTLRILAPLGDETDWRSNAASIIMQVQYGDVEFLLTGDAPDSIERYLVELAGDSLESEVLKLGHHGSNTSSDGSFLDTVTPEYAVVSAAADSSYGHPHREVVERVTERDIPIVSTAEMGTITFESDGNAVWLKK